MHRGGRFQTCPHYGVLMHQTMGSTRALHHTGQRPALPGAMRTRSPTVVAPIIPVTACIVGAGFKPAPTPHHGVLIRQTMGSTRALHHTGQRPALPGAMRIRSPAVVAPIIPVTACIVGQVSNLPPPWRANAPNDGFHPHTQAPASEVVPCSSRLRGHDACTFTRCCRADHTRHRMHRGGRFQTCPHHGVLMHQTMGSTRALHHAGQRPSLPSEMCTHSPAVVLPIIPVTACIVGAGFKPAPTMAC